MNKTNDFPIVEAFLSGVSIWWAVVLVANANFLDNRIPDYMSVFNNIQEIIWASGFIVAAIIKVVGLITMNLWCRKIGLACSMVLYSLVTTGYILSDHIIHTGTGVYFLLTVLAWFGWREVKINVKRF